MSEIEDLQAENERLREQVEELSARPDWTAYNAVRDKFEEAAYEVGRLQAALDWIAANEVDPIDSNRIAQLEAMIRRARQALEEK